MIGFNSLGKLGRLGNQMFQYAALKGIADHHGYQICIPFSNGRDEWSEHQLNQVFKMSTLNNLNYQNIDSSRPTVMEETFHYNQNLFDHCPDWINLYGFFQSEKYFKHIRKQLLIDFEFHDSIMNVSKEVISNWNNPISLHIRRTDYVTNPNHTVLGHDYYEQALSMFDEFSEVIVFSDEPDWCMQQKIFESDRFSVSKTNNAYIDLCLMSLCSSHIIANSSFSWWGAWLSESKKVISPSGWFENSNNEHLNTKDLIPENWIVI